MTYLKKLFNENLNIIIILNILMLCIALICNNFDIDIDLPYAYFTFLRWITTVSTLGIIYKIFKEHSNSKWSILYGIIAITFNPFQPIELEETTWQIIDLIVLLIFIIHLFIQLKVFNLFKNVQNINLLKFLKEFFVDFLIKGFWGLLTELTNRKTSMLRGFIYVVVPILIIFILTVLSMKYFENLSFFILVLCFFLVPAYKMLFINDKRKEDIEFAMAFLGVIIFLIVVCYSIYNSIIGN